VSGDPYVYPDSGGVLRNLLDIHNDADLGAFESGVTYQRLTELSTSIGHVTHAYDTTELCAIHWYIFQDIFDWAGNFRTITLSKDFTNFCHPDSLERRSDELFNWLASEQWLRDRDHTDFVSGASHFLCELNALHPFREGNGRTQRTMLGMIAWDAGRIVDWTQVTRKAHIDASIAGVNGHELPMKGLLMRIVRDVVADRDAYADLALTPQWHAGPDYGTPTVGIDL
jgi:cell filamentation protein